MLQIWKKDILTNSIWLVRSASTNEIDRKKLIKRSAKNSIIPIKYWDILKWLIGYGVYTYLPEHHMITSTRLWLKGSVVIHPSYDGQGIISLSITLTLMRAPPTRTYHLCFQFTIKPCFNAFLNLLFDQFFVNFLS